MMNKIKMLPEQLHYRVGDTMVFVSSFPVSDLLENPADTARIEVNTQLTCVSYNEGLPYAALDFDSYVAQGKQVHFGDLAERNILSFNYAVEGDRYVARVGIIPRKAGPYTFGPYQILVRTKDKGNCYEEAFRFINYVNDNNNIELRDSLLGYIETTRRQAYSFIVD